MMVRNCFLSVLRKRRLAGSHTDSSCLVTAVFELSTVSAFDRKSKITYPILRIQVDEEDCNHMCVDELDLAGNMEIGLC